VKETNRKTDRDREEEREKNKGGERDPEMKHKQEKLRARPCVGYGDA